MVITGLTRNQVDRKVSWVRIPPPPPTAAFTAYQKAARNLAAFSFSGNESANFYQEHTELTNKDG